MSTIQRAVDFYSTAPDGQYDEFVAQVLPFLQDCYSLIARIGGPEMPSQQEIDALMAKLAEFGCSL